MGLFDKIYGGPLTQAVKNGDLAEVQKMLRNGGNPNEKQLGISVLMNACSAGNMELVKLLIEKGADVNARDWDGMSILMVAATAPGFGDPDLKENLCLEMVEALLKAGADPGYKSWRRRTAIKEAEWVGHNKVVELLKTSGAVK